MISNCLLYTSLLKTSMPLTLISLFFIGIEERKIIMKKTMILTSMALMSLVAVGCANEEVKDTQDNQPVISTNMEEVQTEGLSLIHILARLIKLIISVGI